MDTTVGWGGHFIWIMVSNDRLRQIVAMGDTTEELARICGVDYSTIMSSIERGGQDCIYERVYYEESLPPQPMIKQAPLPKGYGRKNIIGDGTDVVERQRERVRNYSRRKYAENPQAKREKSLAYYYRKKAERGEAGKTREKPVFEVRQDGESVKFPSLTLAAEKTGRSAPGIRYYCSFASEGAPRWISDPSGIKYTFCYEADLKGLVKNEK